MLKKCGFAARISIEHEIAQSTLRIALSPGLPISIRRPGALGTTFLLFSQNRNCIARVALLRERVPRSAFGLQSSARTQVYPQ
jgi:hypothetical protein